MAKVADILSGFMRETITMPNDYDGACVTTLISKKCATASTKAVLYVHGYCDYFFQTELADFYNKQGYNFYAVDLRKYGRSLLPNQRFNFCKSMNEYYADLDACMKIIRTTDGNTKVLLNGHSTGGLLASVYAHDRVGANTIQAVFLNSPFFDFNDSWWMEGFTELTIDAIGFATPYLKMPSSGLPFYGESVHKDYNRGGTYTFNEDWKPVRKWVPDVLAGWARAIHKAHERVWWGLSIKAPTLVMYSDKSGGGATWNESYNNSDCVLDVNDINSRSDYLCYDAATWSYKKPTEIKVVNGLHDLACSRAAPRADFYAKLKVWLDANFK